MRGWIFLVAMGLAAQDDDFIPPQHDAACPAKCAPCRQAVKKALDYLAQSQKNDGSWDVKMIAYQEYGNSGAIPTAALAGVCLVAADPDKYKGHIAKAFDFLVKKLDDTNDYLKEPPKRGMMRHWQLSYTLLFFTEAYDKSDKRGEAIRRVVRELVKAQDKSGGWQHGFEPTYGPIVSVTITCLSALASAKQLGFEVPDPTIDRGVKYLNACVAKDGAILYSPSFNADIRNGDEARAAGVAWVLKRLGKTEAPAYVKASKYAAENLTRIPNHSLHSSAWALFMGALFARRDPGLWKKYWEHYRDDLHEAQARDGHFRWQRKWDNFYELDGVIGPAWNTTYYTLVMMLPTSDRLLLTKGESK